MGMPPPMVAHSWRNREGAQHRLTGLCWPESRHHPDPDRAGGWRVYLVFEQKLVPADEDFPQPLQHLGPVRHLLVDEFATDLKEHL